MIPTRTWRWKGGLATWTLRLPRGSGGASDAMRQAVLQVVGSLAPFARPTKASWTTEQDGEDAVVLDLDQDPRPALAQSVPESPIQVDLDLTLLVRTPDGESELPDGATLWLELEDEAIAVVLSLDVDLYAWRTWGEERDNAVLARLNAPRLSAFLASLLQAGATVLDLDAGDYRGQATAQGFQPPAEE